MGTAATSDRAAPLVLAIYSGGVREFLKISLAKRMPQLNQQLKHEVKAKPSAGPKPVVETVGCTRVTRVPGTVVFPSSALGKS